MIKLDVSKQGKDVLTSTNPNDFIFKAEYNTFKIIAHGTVSSQSVNASPKTFTLAHGQSGTPGVFAFAKFPDAITVLPNEGQRSKIGRYWVVEVDNTNVYFIFYKAEDTTFDTGLSFPGTVANDDAVGTVDWNNINRVKSSDGSYANVVLDIQQSHWLKMTNFGFNVPSNATITGIQMQIKSYESEHSDDWLLDYIRIVKDGNIRSTNRSMYINGGSEDTRTTGGDGDLWGQTDWTPTKINSSGFGVAISTFAFDSPVDVKIDYVRLKVYYTIPDDDYSVDLSYYIFEVPL